MQQYHAQNARRINPILQAFSRAQHILHFSSAVFSLSFTKSTCQIIEMFINFPFAAASLNANFAVAFQSSGGISFLLVQAS